MVKKTTDNVSKKKTSSKIAKKEQDGAGVRDFWKKTKQFLQGKISPKNRFISKSLEFNFPIHRAYKDLSKKEKDILWNGHKKCKGINQFFDYLETKKYKIQARVLIARYRGKTSCDECLGSRLRKETQFMKISGKNTATNIRVVAIIANVICFDPL